jgi:hypothetical protein
MRFRALDKNARNAERSFRVKSTQQSNFLPATRRKSVRSRRLRRAIKMQSTPEMAGSRSAHSLETTIVTCASGKRSRKAETAGVVRVKSPIRLSCRRRIFTRPKTVAALYERRNRRSQQPQNDHRVFRMAISYAPSNRIRKWSHVKFSTTRRLAALPIC